MPAYIKEGLLWLTFLDLSSMRSFRTLVSNGSNRCTPVSCYNDVGSRLGADNPSKHLIGSDRPKAGVAPCEVIARQLTFIGIRPHSERLLKASENMPRPDMPVPCFVLRRSDERAKLINSQR